MRPQPPRPPLPAGFDSPGEFLAALARDVGGLVSYVDRDERIRFASRRLAEWFQSTPEAILGKTLAELYGAEAYAQF